ncbi:MAG: TlpA family protein disulfide reductase [Acidobacteria bacterium]|jgi:peroxiredoxin|nr:TlpA family protein disulfide reductase [Acidobacteriota bacterium]
MKILLTLAILLTAFTFQAQAQHEYAPIQQQEIKYKNWNYKSVRDDKTVDLREFARNKKLVMVVYFAQWCPNWKLEAPVAQRFYDKYKQYGFAVVGVSEYDTVAATRANLDAQKITFPVVSESDSKDAKQKTAHYEYRRKTGDTRGWGSPWNIFLEPANLEKNGETLTKNAFVVNGELIESDAEKFVRQKLGLPAEDIKTANGTTSEKKVEACEPDKKSTAFKKPELKK